MRTANPAYSTIETALPTRRPGRQDGVLPTPREPPERLPGDQQCLEDGEPRQHDDGQHRESHDHAAR